VEDHQDGADSLRMILDLWGYDARVAHTGRDGLELAVRWTPDVIISDLGLPQMDGFDLALNVRREPALAGVRLICVTGYGDAATAQKACECGYDVFLTKPVDPEALHFLLLSSGGASE
jgi:DNA-binding response OmpR family regulator